jgi:hypothetical protein
MMDDASLSMLLLLLLSWRLCPSADRTRTKATTAR